VEDFRIHAQLLEDCHVLGRLRLSHLLLHRNSALPWFVLVPRVEPELVELFELDAVRRTQLEEEIDAVARFVKSYFTVEKINIGAIGNAVRQLHVHVIGRRPGDPCWPRVAWGNLTSGRPWEAARLSEITTALRAQLELGQGVL
jgi:diadenosine tetraphosphate (Ap4A) HIT family hydrolase